MRESWTGGRVVPALLLLLAAVGLCNVVAANSVSETAPVADSQQGKPGKVALLVGISEYSPSGGWSNLNTVPDLERIRAGLEIQGFAPQNIHTLTDSDADQKGIAAAFRRHLIEGAGKGAVAFFHYSGHGQRITDDDHDEVDGYDETLVSYDAPQKLVAGYDGSKHLRDDDLHDWVQELRRKIGPDGDVVISLDSCFSGAATRGGTARGSLDPLGPPQAPLDGQLGADSAGGFVEGSRSSTRGVGGPAAPAGAGVPAAASAASGDGKLAPFVVISSARHDELAFETRDEQGRAIGSLSFALGTALAVANAETTYTSLHDQVKRIMAGQVRNRPQLEGQPNRRILGGEAVSQKPFYEILSYYPEGKFAEVKGGALAGLLEGSKVAVHPAGTREYLNATPLAVGQVRKSRSLMSEIVFDTVADGADIENGWLFVTEPSFGDVRIRAHIGAGAWRAALVEHLEARKLIEQTDGKEDSDVVIEESGRGVEIYQAIDDTQLLAPLAADDPRLSFKLRETLEDFARNRWLRRVDAKSPDIQVSFDIRPCRLETTENDFGDTISSCGADLERTTEGGELEVRIGDAFEMKLVNNGKKDAYVVVLDLMPDGRIGLLYPAEDEMGEDNKLDHGKSFTIPTPFLIGEPLGNEMLKLFATSHPVDFRPILSGNFNPGASTRGVLDAFLGGAFDGTRASPTITSGPVSTASLPFTVSAAEKP